MGDMLKPCPFCGSPDPAIIEGAERFYVACSSLDCYVALGEIWDRDAMPEHLFATREEAETAWNTRPEAPQEGWREALEPFAKACTISTAEDGADIDDTIAATKITWGDLRRARATFLSLSKGEGVKDELKGEDCG